MNRCSPPSSAGNTPAPPQFAVPAAADEKPSNGYFLDTCALCKRKLMKSQDRYMYGYLQAFCSVGCRDVRVALDELANPPSPIRCPNVSCSVLGLNDNAKKSRR